MWPRWSAPHGRSNLAVCFRVDLATKQAMVLREGIDPFGVAVFTGIDGKRLYYALARASKVYSLALDQAGNTVGEPREEADFSDQGVRGDEQARRIIMGSDMTMSLRLIQFDFTLAASTDPRQTILYYLYDTTRGRWVLQDLSART